MATRTALAPSGGETVTNALTAADTQGQTSSASLTIEVLPGGQTNLFLPLLSR